MGHSAVRLNWLDSMRGIAALAVASAHLVSHYRDQMGVMNDFQGKILNIILNDFIDFGKSGVILFFCISGFIIPSSIKTGNISSVFSFVISRIARLYPLYWLSILTFFWFPWDDIKSWTPGMVAFNATMIQNYLGVESLRGVYWTLHIEIVFYFVCVCLAVFGFLHRLMPILIASIGFTAIALAISCARYLLEIKFPVALPMALALMFWASLRSKAMISGNENANKYSNVAICIFLFALLPICLLAYNKDYGFNESWYRYLLSYLFGVGAFVFLQRIHIRSSLVVFFGVISYSIYLMHPAVFGFMEQSGFQDILIINIGRIGTIMLTLGLVIIVSTATFYAIEVPFQRAGARARRWVVSAFGPAAHVPSGVGP